jgi:imidazolonepropionase
MGMSPEEAINAATINGAHAMGLSKELGSITKGKKANFIITKTIKSYSMIPYAFGSNLIEDVYIKGKSINIS